MRTKPERKRNSRYTTSRITSFPVILQSSSSLSPSCPKVLLLPKKKQNMPMLIRCPHLLTLTCALGFIVAILVASIFLSCNFAHSFHLPFVSTSIRNNLDFYSNNKNNNHYPVWRKNYHKEGNYHLNINLGSYNYRGGKVVTMDSYDGQYNENVAKSFRKIVVPSNDNDYNNSQSNGRNNSASYPAIEGKGEKEEDTTTNLDRDQEMDVLPPTTSIFKSKSKSGIIEENEEENINDNVDKNKNKNKNDIIENSKVVRDFKNMAFEDGQKKSQRRSDVKVLQKPKPSKPSKASNEKKTKNSRTTEKRKRNSSIGKGEVKIDNRRRQLTSKDEISSSNRNFYSAIDETSRSMRIINNFNVKGGFSFTKKSRFQIQNAESKEKEFSIDEYIDDYLFQSRSSSPLLDANLLIERRKKRFLNEENIGGFKVSKAKKASPSSASSSSSATCSSSSSLSKRATKTQATTTGAAAATAAPETPTKSNTSKAAMVEIQLVEMIKELKRLTNVRAELKQQNRIRYGLDDPNFIEGNLKNSRRSDRFEPTLEDWYAESIRQGVFTPKSHLFSSYRIEKGENLDQKKQKQQKEENEIKSENNDTEKDLFSSHYSDLYSVETEEDDSDDDVYSGISLNDQILSQEGLLEFYWRIYTLREAPSLLIQLNTGILLNVVKKYAYLGGSTHADLFQEATKEFVKAAETFDTSRGYRLNSYAIRIVAQKLNIFATQSNSVGLHLPSHLLPLIIKLNRLEGSIEMKRAQDKSTDFDRDEYICDEMKISPQKLLYLRRFKPVAFMDETWAENTFVYGDQESNIPSLASTFNREFNVPTARGKKKNPTDTLANDKNNNRHNGDSNPYATTTEQYVESLLLRKSLAKAISENLNYIERDIIRMVMGLDDPALNEDPGGKVTGRIGGKKSLRDVSSTLGLSYYTVLKFYDDAIFKLYMSPLLIEEEILKYHFPRQ